MGNGAAFYLFYGIHDLLECLRVLLDIALVKHRHRCLGAYIAIQETDIFLRKLLAIKNLRLVSDPVVSYKQLIEGYEVRNFIVAVD